MLPVKPKHIFGQLRISLQRIAHTIKDEQSRLKPLTLIGRNLEGICYGDLVQREVLELCWHVRQPHTRRQLLCPPEMLVFIQLEVAVNYRRRLYAKPSPVIHTISRDV